MALTMGFISLNLHHKPVMKESLHRRRNQVPGERRALPNVTQAEPRSKPVFSGSKFNVLVRFPQLHIVHPARLYGDAGCISHSP